MKKKLLLISYSFPPIKGIGSIRNFNVANQFEKHFQTKILSTNNRFKLPLEEIDVKKFSVKYLFTLDYKTLKGKSHLKEGGSYFQKRTKKISFINKLTESFPFNLIFGEGGLFYVLHGLYVSVRLYKKGYHIIYSSFRPMADHYIAYLSKIFHKNRIWIADFRDLPYYDSLSDVYLFPKFQMYILKKIISRADYVTTISEGLKTFFEKYNCNVIVLRNGINKLKEPIKSESKLDKFTITYTGSFYEEKRNPELLFKALSNLVLNNIIDLKKINLVYAGKDSEVWENYAVSNSLNDSISLKGMVSNQNAKILQQNTHINVLFSWATKKQKGILTGKFYEYLNAQKKLLVIINGEQDLEFEKIVNELTIGKVFYNNETKKIEQFLLKKYKEWEVSGKIESKVDQEKLRYYTWDVQSKILMEELKKT